MKKIFLDSDSKGDRDRFLNLIYKTEDLFKPSLSDRVKLKDYCEKLLSEGVVIVISNEERDYVAGCAFYCTPKIYDFAFLSYIASLEKGFGNELMNEMIDYCMEKGMAGIETQTWSSNTKSISLFERHGFVVYDKVLNRSTDEESVQLRCTFND